MTGRSEAGDEEGDVGNEVLWESSVPLFGFSAVITSRVGTLGSVSRT